MSHLLSQPSEAGHPPTLQLALEAALRGEIRSGKVLPRRQLLEEASLVQLVRHHPLEVPLWIALSQRYALAGLAPQWGYVRRQVARLNPATGASLPNPDDGDARAITAAQEHLAHLGTASAQRWADALDTWLGSTPGG